MSFYNMRGQPEVFISPGGDFHAPKPQQRSNVVSLEEILFGLASQGVDLQFVDEEEEDDGCAYFYVNLGEEYDEDEEDEYDEEGSPGHHDEGYFDRSYHSGTTTAATSPHATTAYPKVYELPDTPAPEKQQQRQRQRQRQAQSNNRHPETHATRGFSHGPQWTEASQKPSRQPSYKKEAAEMASYEVVHNDVLLTVEYHPSTNVKMYPEPWVKYINQQLAHQATLRGNAGVVVKHLRFQNKSQNPKHFAPVSCDVQGDLTSLVHRSDGSIKSNATRPFEWHFSWAA